MTKTSKRQQKFKATQSLKSKANGAGASGLDILSDELRQQYEESGMDPSELIITSGGGKQKAAKGGKKEGGSKGEPAPQQELSKSQLRKLKQVQQKKERRENLSQVLAQLNAHAASDTTLSLLRPLHQRGARETKKQRLKRELQLQRAGLGSEVVAQLQEAAAASGVDGGGRHRGSELLRERTVEEEEVENEVSELTEEEDDEEEEEEEEERKGAGGTSAAQAGAGAGGSGAGAEPGSGASSEEEEEEESEDGAAGAAKGGASGRAVQGPQQQGKQAKQGQPPQDPAAARKAALRAAKAEAERIRKQELGGMVPAVQDEQLGDTEVAALRAQAAAAAAEAAHYPHRVVAVERPPALAEQRAGLPIIGQEADIMEAVAAHDVVVLAGETGCGKTTQVPQFLLEAGYGCRDFPERAGVVGITQPRRVAAVSTAQRVAEELGCGIGEVVGYQVRYDRCVGAATSLKFMTDGILLRELQLDFLLRGYSAVVVDEAHERGLNTDLLLGMLSRVVPLRRRMWREQQAAAARGQGLPPGTKPVYPLKLIIMSATLRTSDFTHNKRLFTAPPPVINVPARQYPVTVHFSRRTEMVDYVAAAYRKVTRIHSELPPGGILVFMTGQREVEQLCARLRGHYAAAARRRQLAAEAAAGGGRRNARDAGSEAAVGSAAAMEVDGYGPGDAGRDDEEEEAAAEQYGGGGDRAEVAGEEAGRRRKGDGEPKDDYEDLNGEDGEGDEDEEEVVVMGGDQFTPEEIAAAEKRFEEQYGRPLAGGGGGQKAGGGGGGDEAAAAGGTGRAGGGGGAGGEDAGPGPVYVLPLYAMLSQERQARVFAPSAPGHRLIIVATNVAETSLTIPGIRYVVDAGRSKQKLLEDAGGGQLARYEVRWISKASAQQRAGRAGRTCPGHAYRLFSSAHFNDTFPEHSPPEIINTALEGTVLVMKAMGVDKVHNFPFPTPPEAAALRSAHGCLEALGALAPGSGALTDVGRAMAAFPISPRHARMLLEVLKWQKAGLGEDGPEQGPGAAVAARGEVVRRAARALPYAVALAAALSVESPFVHIDTVGRPEEEEAGGKGDDDEEEDEEEDEGRAGRKGKGKRGRQGRKGRGGDGEDEEEEDEGEEQDEEEEDEDGRGGRRRGGKAGPGPSSAKAAAAAAKQATQRKRQHAAAMQARFRSAHSDALSALAALVAFEAHDESDAFATEHFLHARNLREAADLHRQLLRSLTLQQVGGSPAAEGGRGGGGSDDGGGALAADLAAAAKELSGSIMSDMKATAAAALMAAAEKARSAAAKGTGGEAAAVAAALVPERIADVLRRAMAAGWADQVARRARSAEYLARLGESRRKRHAVRYEPACLLPALAEPSSAQQQQQPPAPGAPPEQQQHVFLHPRSALHGAAPELVVYTQLLRTAKRPYMAGLTTVEAEWLTQSGTPLCVLSDAPLPDPAPAYRAPPTDAVVAWREARYGPRAWALPPVVAPHPDATERCAVFAAALLEGKVLPGMADLRPHLAASPAMLLRPELRGVARVGELVAALARARVDSCRSLVAAWRSDSSLLQRELAAWLSKSQQGALLRAWPQLQAQARAVLAQGAAAAQAAGGSGGGAGVRKKGGKGGDQQAGAGGKGGGGGGAGLKAAGGGAGGGVVKRQVGGGGHAGGAGGGKKKR